MLNLDTHILVDFVQGQLEAEERKIVFDDEIAISDIVLWEISKLVQLKRLVLDMQDRRLRAFFNLIQIIPIDMDVAIASTELDFHSDPADEIIAATSVVHRIPLVTRDKRILRSKIVPFA